MTFGMCLYEPTGGTCSIDNTTPENSKWCSTIPENVNEVVTFVNTKTGVTYSNSYNFMYSEQELNPHYNYGYTLGTGYDCYAGTFDYTNTTTNKTYRVLTFEDWHNIGDGSDMDLNDMVFFITSGDPLKIPEVTDVDVVSKTFTWLVAAEDLGTTDDFDFNDMVVSVSSLPTTDVDNDNHKYSEVKFKALAAGGTLPLYLHLVGRSLYKGKTGTSSAKFASSCVESTVDGVTDLLLYPDNGSASNPEWHAWFGNGNISSSTMINTTADGVTVNGRTSTIYLDGEYSISNYGNVDKTTNGQYNINGFCITVGNNDLQSCINDPATNKTNPQYPITAPAKEEAPQMFVILDIGKDSSHGWQWPIERKDITEAYSDFKLWAADHESNQNWHKNPNEGYVIAERSTTHYNTYTEDSGNGGGDTPVTPTSKVTFTLVTEGASVWGNTVNIYSLKFSSTDWENCTGIQVTTSLSPDLALFSDSSCTSQIISGIYSTTIPKSSIKSIPDAVDGIYTIYFVDFKGGTTAVDLY